MNAAKQAEKLKDGLLPKGLREFEATLSDPEYSPELLERLKELPEFGVTDTIERHKEALRAVEEAERHLSSLKSRAADIAQQVWFTVINNWSIKEIQEATGYDEE